MSKKTVIEPKNLYKGCYSCRFFERQGKSLSGYGKCKKPLKEAYFCVNIEHFENGTFSYPERYYPTAGICCVDGCENWEAN